MEDIIAKIAIYAIPILLAITLHEAAHGYVARMFGDNTAYLAGRITLNPLKHIDPIGTVVVPLSLFLLSSLAGSGGILFGWAKPVPVNFGNLHHPKQDMLWVAAAGPAANLAMAFGWVLLFKILTLLLPEYFSTALSEMLLAGIMINVVLMVFNLLPLPPLDGGRIAVSLLPHKAAWQLSRLEPYGFIIILVLLLSNVLQHVLQPFIRLALQVVGWVI